MLDKPATEHLSKILRSLQTMHKTFLQFISADKRTPNHLRQTVHQCCLTGAGASSNYDERGLRKLGDAKCQMLIAAYRCFAEAPAANSRRTVRNPDAASGSCMASSATVAEKFGESGRNCTFRKL